VLPYWNDDIKNAVKARNTARNKMYRSKKPDDCNNYRRLKGRCQQIIKTTARQHWQDYCSTLQSTTRLSTVWATARRMTGVNSNHGEPTLVSNGINYDTNSDKAELFVNTFADVNSNDNYSDRFKQQKTATLNEYRATLQNDVNDATSTAPAAEYLNDQFELHELYAAIRKAKKNSSAGDDRVSYDMLQHLPKRCRQIVLRYYNRIWTTGDIPADYKHAIITPIPKPTKSAHDPTSYRPICLTSTIEKIMERLVTDRLSYHMEKEQLLTNVQCGFRKGRSTIDQIIKLQDEINRNINNGRATLGVFIDFERAFDMLWRDGLLIKLQNLNIKGKMYNWIKSFLTDRTIQVKIGDTLSSSRKLDNGSPQGSPLSPLLFLIAINDLPEVLHDVETSLFADDSAIYRSDGSHQLKRTADIIQENLDAVQTWCDKWGFKMSTKKTVGVLFTHDTKLKAKLQPITVNGQPIKVERAAKFWGVYFDERLTWKQHIDYIINKLQVQVAYQPHEIGHRFQLGSVEDQPTTHLPSADTVRHRLRRNRIRLGNRSTETTTRLHPVPSTAHSYRRHDYNFARRTTGRMWRNAATTQKTRTTDQIRHQSEVDASSPVVSSRHNRLEGRPRTLQTRN